MEISVNRDEFLPVVNRVIGVVERRQTIPILGNLLLAAEGSCISVTGSDLEVEIQASGVGEVSVAGRITVPARKFADILRSLADGTQVSVKVTGDRCVVLADRARFSLTTLPAQDFPSVQFLPADESILLGGSDLRRVLEKTSFAMAQQDVRYYLNGLLFKADHGGVSAVATDGHRLALCEYVGEVDIQTQRSVIIPFKTVVELRRQLAVDASLIKVDFSDRMIRFHVGQTVTTSKLVDGRYPDFSRVIPAGLPRFASVDRDALRRALSRTAILSNEKYRGVKLLFESGVLRLVAHNPEQEEAVEELELDYNGDSIAVGFNVAYLADLLAAVDSERVDVSFEDGDKSSVWRGSGVSGETYVVMPMRL